MIAYEPITPQRPNDMNTTNYRSQYDYEYFDVTVTTLK